MRDGILETEKYLARLKSCTLCGHHCQADRLGGETGICGAAAEIRISSFGPHHGEEPELTGYFGSGTVFFTGCNLGCVFCQNYDISQESKGVKIDREGLVRVMLDLQNKGCHNINWVSPTHLTPLLLPALEEARSRGLEAPLVYNTGGFDSSETLKMLEGWVDIYMPDAKYGDSGMAKRYSGAPGYWEVNRAALREMHHQVGDLLVEEGVARRGLLVRHLVLPEDISASLEVFKFIAEELSPDTYVNIMDQYRPSYKALEFPEISRRIDHEEYRTALMLARSLGLRRGFTDYWD